MMQAAFDKFIEPLRAAFNDPPGNRHEEFFAQLAKIVAKYERGAMTGAAEHIIATRTQRGFPTIGECRKALHDAAGSSKPKAKRGSDDHPEWSRERVAEADALICSDLGVEACMDGWIGALHDFCRENQRLPEGREIDGCKRVAAGADRALQMVGNDSGITSRRKRQMDIVDNWHRQQHGSL